MKPKVCFIFIGEPRLINKNISYLSDLLTKGDVFIVSDNSTGWPCFDGFNYYFCHEYPKYREREKHVKEIMKCNALLQWLKLDFFLENVNLDAYELVVKLRTDLAFPIELKTDFEPDTLYMNSDYAFGGTLESFSVLSGFFKWAVTNYFNNNSFVKLDLSKINDCDMAAARFHWLKLPKFMKYFTYRKVITNLFIKAFSKQINNCKISGTAHTTRRNWESIKFMSEVAFLHYVLNSGLTVKKISDNWITLDSTRHS